MSGNRFRPLSGPRPAAGSFPDVDGRETRVEATEAANGKGPRQGHACRERQGNRAAVAVGVLHCVGVLEHRANCWVWSAFRRHRAIALLGLDRMFVVEVRRIHHPHPARLVQELSDQPDELVGALVLAGQRAGELSERTFVEHRGVGQRLAELNEGASGADRCRF